IKELHFGQRHQGSAAPHHMVRLLGPPIARACTSRASDDWIRVNPAPEGFDITVDTARTGPLRGHLDLKGLTREAAIAIDAEILPRAAPVSQPATAVPVPAGPPEGAPSAQGRQKDTEATQPRPAAPQTTAPVAPPAVQPSIRVGAAYA